jgi:uncharacterized protein YuzE
MVLVTFDREAKALYIKVRSGKVAKTIPMWDGAFMDVSKDGKAIGVEIVFAESTPQEAINAIIESSKSAEVARAKSIKLLSAR